MAMHLSTAFFEHRLPQRGSSAIGNVMQGDCIKAISAKWNMCPVSVAYSLIIRLFTSETNLEKKTKMFMALWIGGTLADVTEGRCCLMIYSEYY